LHAKRRPTGPADEKRRRVKRRIRGRKKEYPLLESNTGSRESLRKKRTAGGKSVLAKKRGGEKKKKLGHFLTMK